MAASYGPVTQFGRARRPKLLTPLGWYTALSVIACAIGAALGFAS